ncbi:MAG: tetratricopeptide repeat protein [Candidatus Aegiribacteria sp.]
MDDTIAELQNRLASVESDSERARILAELAWSVKYSSPSRAVELGERSLELVRSSGDSSPFPKASLAMAMGYLHMSRFQEAEDAGLAGLAHYQEEDSFPGIRHGMNVMGAIYSSWDKPGKALEHYLEAKRIDSELSQTPDPGILSNIGSVYMKLGDCEKALDYFLRVREIAADMEGPADLKAAACLNLGEAYRAMEMYDEALIHYIHGADICRNEDMKSYAATAEVSIGTVKMELGDMVEALNRFDEALSIYNQLGDRHGAADVLLNMGESNLLTERHRIALSFFNEALHIYRELDTPQGVTEALFGIASSMEGMGRLEDALRRLHQAREMASEMGFKPLLVKIHGKLADICQSLGRAEKALEYHRELYRMDREVHSERTEERLLKLGISHQVEKSRREAEIYRLKNIELSRDRDSLKEKMLRRTRELEKLNREMEFTQNVREQLEMELGRDRRLASLGEIAGGIAHDFRNILSVISGNAELVMNSENLSRVSTDRMESIMDATLSGAALAGQLMSFGRRMPDEKGLIHLNQIIGNMLGMLERTVGPGIRFEKKLDKADPAILGDKLQIENLLVNLVLNARDSMKDGGTIKVTLKRQKASEAGTPDGLFAASDDLLRLEVTDQGHGISQEHLDRVFDPFFTTKQKEGGSGLGLSVVHSIVVQHKGWIKVRSTVGRGSTFSIFFPEAPNTGK